MKLLIPIVDLIDGDVIFGLHRDGETTLWQNPITVTVTVAPRPTVSAMMAGRPTLLLPIGYPPGVLFHIVRGEAVPGAIPKPPSGP
jgi:hypothetical protein